MRRRCCSLAVGAALILLGVLPDTSAAQGARPGRSGSSFQNGHGHQGHGHQGHRGHGHRGNGTIIVGPPFFGSPFYGSPFYGSPFYGSTMPVYTPPVVYYTPPPAYYYPPPQAYAPAPAYAPPAPAAPPVISQDVQPATRDVVFSSGRWVLQGDGVAVPYRWVWIPNAPTAPPGTASPAPEAERHVYAWTDAAGVTTYTDRLSKVPPEHRSTARRDP